MELSYRAVDRDDGRGMRGVLLLGASCPLCPKLFKHLMTAPMENKPMSEELKACPFCGGKADLEEDNFAATCYACGFSYSGEGFDSLEQLAEKWNMRPKSDAEARALDAKPRDGFVKDLQSLINSYSIENLSNTPDFILAEYMWDCLVAWGKWTRRREEWYGRGDSPAEPSKEKL